MKIGMLGSPLHVFSNDAVKDKTGCLKDLTKEGFKDVAVLTGVSAAAAGAGAAAVKFSPKAAELLKTGTSKVKDVAKKVFNPETLAKVKNSSIFKKAASLPPWAKAAIGIGAAALAIITPIIMTHSAQKSARIEAQYENQ